MADEDPPVEDDEVAALLRRASEQSVQQPRHRERARSAMFAEFDAIVGTADVVDSREHLSLVPAADVDEEPDSASGSFVARWTAAAAACLIVLALVVIANFRDDSATSDGSDRSVPTSPETLPGVEDPPRTLTAESPPVALDDGSYRTDDIGDGLVFSGADGLQLVALRPGLVVMDAVSAGGDLQGRITVIETDRAAIAEVIDAAVEDGHLQVSEARFTVGDQSLRRQDLTVTGDGVADLECVGQDGCLPLADGDDEFAPAVWARSENFLVEASSAEPAMFVLVQTTAFGDPLLGQAFEFVDSFRLE